MVKFFTSKEGEKGLEGEKDFYILNTLWCYWNLSIIFIIIKKEIFPFVLNRKETHVHMAFVVV